MSVIVKSEPNIVVELSSDDEEMVSTTNKEITTPGLHPDRPSTPDTQCSICLDDLINKCYSNACWHLFCFECLKRWSNSEPTCPLCKKAFIHIYHTFTEQGLHETYDVVPQEMAPPQRIFIRPLIDLSSDINRMNLFMDIVRRGDLINNLHDLNHNDTTGTPIFLNEDYASPAIHRPIMGQASRIRVYIENAWAEPLPDSSGRYRDCSSFFFRNNPAQTYRLHGFILRDLIAVREATRIEGRASTILETADLSITNLIMRSISTYEIRESFMVNILLPFLAEHTTHFCHELYNYANSPYDIIGYDRHVQYNFRNRLYTPSTSATGHLNDLRRSPPGVWQLSSPPIPIIQSGPIINETIVLDSDNEEDQNTAMDIIVLSSETDGSDVEMIPYSHIGTLSSSSMDQPSTSTGIRDSLDRPNNRYNLRRRRLVSPTVNESSSIPVHVSRVAPGFSRGLSILDSSSDDEESTTASQTQNRMKSRDVKKKKRKSKKNKHKKRKRNIYESRYNVRSSNRGRSYSESSSSSGETDTTPNDSCVYKRCTLPK